MVKNHRQVFSWSSIRFDKDPYGIPDNPYQFMINHAPWLSSLFPISRSTSSCILMSIATKTTAMRTGKRNLDFHPSFSININARWNIPPLPTSTPADISRIALVTALSLSLLPVPSYRLARLPTDVYTRRKYKLNLQTNNHRESSLHRITGRSRIHKSMKLF